MKRVVKILCILALFLSLSIIGANAQMRSISVYLDGAKLSFDVEPTILQDRTMVPMRTIFESMGAVVHWDEKTRAINAEKGKLFVTMQIDNTIMTKNGHKSLLDVPPVIQNNRTLVPVRAVAQTFDADVLWDDKDSNVIIISKKIPVYKDYPDIPDFGAVMDCKPIKKETVGKMSSFLYQLSSKENDKYIEALSDMEFVLITTNSTKETRTSQYKNEALPRITVKVISLPNLQTRIEIITNDKIKIFIDAGHNDSGKDIGAMAYGLREQDITYAIAKKLGALLEDADFEIMYSRKNKKDNIGTSVEESLAIRSKMANDFGADYFISVHCNAFEDETICGTETFIYGKGGQAELLANKVQSSMVKALGTVDREVKVKNFGVLRMTKMPAIMVEPAFITNKSEAKILKEKQDVIAQAIFDGINEYLGMDKKK